MRSCRRGDVIIRRKTSGGRITIMARLELWRTKGLNPARECIGIKIGAVSGREVKTYKAGWLAMSIQINVNTIERKESMVGDGAKGGESIDRTQVPTGAACMLGLSLFSGRFFPNTSSLLQNLWRSIPLPPVQSLHFSNEWTVQRRS